MVRTGNRLTGYYGNVEDLNSDDDDKWHLIHSGTATVVGDTHVALQAWSHNNRFADQDVKVAFDNFVIKKGTIIRQEEEQLPTIPLPFSSQPANGEQHLQVQVPTLASQEEKVWEARPDFFSKYRSGFEVLTYRRCHRVLMFHRFPDELGSEPYLVSSTEFKYSDLFQNSQQPIAIKEELEHQGSTRFASFIQSVIQSGYVSVSNQGQSGIVVNGNRAKYNTYIKKSLPPVEFEYSKPRISDEKKEEIDAASLENLPIGLDGMLYQWVDLRRGRCFRFSYGTSGCLVL